MWAHLARFIEGESIHGWRNDGGLPAAARGARAQEAHEFSPYDHGQEDGACQNEYRNGNDQKNLKHVKHDASSFFAVV
jgi:hypothetical protein